MEAIFNELAEAGDQDPVTQIESRQIRAVRRAGGVIWFDFRTLCGGPRSQNEADRPETGQEEGHRRRRPLHPDHRLAPVVRPRDRLRRPERRPLLDTRGGTQRAIRNHVRRLQALGYTVTLHPAA